jgi:hypothetical protein
MAHANGRLPASALAPIPGNGRLRRDAARAYTAMHLRAKRDRIDLSLWESTMRRTYRPIGAQVLARNYWCSLGKCGNAAPPGTSNHGWGLSVDLASFTQRAWIDRRGAFYGWAKAWSDAPHEWWHLKYRTGVWRLPAGPRTLRKGCRPGKDVVLLQRQLRVLGNRYFPLERKLGTGYGPITRRGVKRFQRDHGLTPDGVVGPTTRRAIARALTRRHHG